MLSGQASSAPTPESLGPPPRRVPLTVQIVCLLGGTQGCLWFWLFFGSLGLCAFASMPADGEMVAYSIFGLTVFGLVSILGAVLVVASLRERGRDRRLLTYGVFAVGRVVAEQGLQSRCSRLTLEVSDTAGQTLEVTGTAYFSDFVGPPTHRRLLYDPARPDNALLLDNGGASNPPELDGRGGFRRPPAGDVATALLWPVLVAAVPLRSLVLMQVITSPGQ